MENIVEQISDLNLDADKENQFIQNDIPTPTQKAKKADIILRNSKKPRSNLANISKYLHILIFDYLTVKEIFKLSRVSRSSHKSQQDEGIWEKYFPNQQRLKLLVELEKVAQKPRTKKQLLMAEYNVVQNLSQRRRFQLYNLIGHDKMITAMDIKDGLIVSGAKDNLVKVWDVKRKKGYTFEKHMNVITQAMVWDERSAITASADKSIRYWDITSEAECVHLKGHGAGVTQIRRLNNSFNRLVSASIDCTVRIWEIYSGSCLQTFSDHGSGVQKIAMNQLYLASYSDQDNLLIIRDFEKGNQLLRVGNFQQLLGYQTSSRSQYAVGFEIGDMIMNQDDPFVLITSESKRIRIWDLRTPLQHRSSQTLENPTSEQFPSKAYALNEKFLHSSSGIITKAFKMHYQPDKYRLVTHFFGARGLFTYDLRKGKQTQYYDFHYYPMTDFTMCNEQLSNFAISSGSTQHLQYDLRPVDLSLPKENHDPEYKINPGHKAVITTIRSDGEYVVTGSKKGELKVMNFNVYKADLSKGPSQITIKN